MYILRAIAFYNHHVITSQTILKEAELQLDTCDAFMRELCVPYVWLCYLRNQIIYFFMKALVCDNNLMFTQLDPDSVVHVKRGQSCFYLVFLILEVNPMISALSQVNRNHCRNRLFV